MHSHQQARIGDRVYVFKQGTGSPRGIIGVGEIVGGPDRRATPTDPEPRWRAEIHFQKLVDPTTELILPLAATEDIVPHSLVAAAARPEQTKCPDLTDRRTKEEPAGATVEAEQEVVPLGPRPRATAGVSGIR